MNKQVQEAKMEAAIATLREVCSARDQQRDDEFSPVYTPEQCEFVKLTADILMSIDELDQYADLIDPPNPKPKPKPELTDAEEEEQDEDDPYGHKANDFHTEEDEEEDEDYVEHAAS